MVRPECLKILAALRKDEIVVAVYQAAFEWLALSPKDLNYTYIGVMGQAAPHGLGLAFAFPKRRQVVFASDGGLLMNLGCLATIANVAPKNFVHFLLNNGMYETTGGQPTPATDRTSFAGIALAAGYSYAYMYDDLDEFGKAAPELLAFEGPVFVELKVVPRAKKYTEDFRKLYSVEGRQAFNRAVQSA